MDMTEKKNDLKNLMAESMEKVKEMVDANTIVGEPITTPDGVTLIPISRLSYGCCRWARRPSPRWIGSSRWCLSCSTGWRAWWRKNAARRISKSAGARID